MSYPSVPQYTKATINRAGSDLANGFLKSDGYKNAIKIVNEWRVIHAYPINTFQATLRRKTREYEDAIIAQRLKRLPTIIDKLKRYPSMDLARMQDIGGVRAIVNNIAEVRELESQYKDTSRFSHELIKVDDYISQPKADGYRGIHLVYRYNNTQARNGAAFEYKGLLVELQLRTKLQHSWATAVETMGTLRDEALKSKQGNKEWLKFFELTSSAFAYAEETPRLDKYTNLSAIDTYKEVTKIENKLQFLEQIKGFSSAVNEIHTQGYSGFYNLIILNPATHSVVIKSYKKSELKQASIDYSDEEYKATSGAKTEPVLVSAGRLKSLRQAYPNYFLDIRDFVSKVEAIIQVSKE